MEFGCGTNVLVGENDSGKTAVIDAIRLCLLTTAADFYRVTRDDFHVGPTGRAAAFTITCGFKDLTTAEQAVFLELLSTDGNGDASLYVSFKGQLMDPLRPSRVSVTTRTGPDGKGPALDGAARELLKATYLRPLRDAEAEMRSGRGSRLSQIPAGYPAMRTQGDDDFDTEEDSATTLVGILRRAEHHISENAAGAGLWLKVPAHRAVGGYEGGQDEEVGKAECHAGPGAAPPYCAAPQSESGQHDGGRAEQDVRHQ